MYMHRTTLLLPGELKTASENYARARRISLGALIRAQLAALVATPEAEARTQDPLFSGFSAFDGAAPRNLAVQHDLALYGPIASSTKSPGQRAKK
jgi:hypothetical protein